MYITAREFGRHFRLQTLVAMVVSGVGVTSGIVLQLVLHHRTAGAWLMGFGIGYALCRMIHGFVEQRFAGRLLREARSSVTIE